MVSLESLIVIMSLSHYVIGFSQSGFVGLIADLATLTKTIIHNQWNGANDPKWPNDSMTLLTINDPNDPLLSLTPAQK